MNWIVFVICAYVTLAMDRGFDLLLTFDGIGPCFTLILAVYVALRARPSTVPWAMIVLGLFQDLSQPYNIGSDSDMLLIGPYCLGYLAGGYVGTQMRGLFSQDSPISLAIAVVAAGAFVHLVCVALLTIRGLAILRVDQIVEWSAANELLRRFFVVLYTSVVAVPVGTLLIRTAPLWRFAATAGKMGRARRLYVGSDRK